jgi:hypothetical protein
MLLAVLCPLNRATCRAGSKGTIVMPVPGFHAVSGWF